MQSKAIVLFSLIIMIMGISYYLVGRVSASGDVPSPGGEFNSNCIHIDTASGIVFTNSSSFLRRFSWFTKRSVDTFVVPSKPTSLYVSVDRIAWFTNENADYVSAINLFTGIEEKFTTGICPCSMIYDGRYVWIVNKGSDTVCAISTSGLFIKEPVHVGLVPVSIAFDGANTLFVALAGEKSIALLDIIREGNVKEKIRVGDDVNYPVKVFCDVGLVWILCSSGLVQVLKRNARLKPAKFELKTAFRMPDTNIYSEIFVDVNKILIGDTIGNVTVLNKTDADYYILQTISIAGSYIKAIHVEDLSDYYILSIKDGIDTLRKYQYQSTNPPYVFKNAVV